mgnify:CR=1 FL=1
MIHESEMELALEILKQRRINSIKKMNKGEFQKLQEEIKEINQKEVEVQKLNENTIKKIIEDWMNTNV